MVNIAIFLCGNVRTWDKCKDSFVELITELSKDNVVDVYISTYTKKYDYHPYIKGVLNFHHDETISKDVFDVKNVEGFEIENSDLISASIKDKKFDPKMKDIYHGYLQYRKCFNCTKLMKKHEKRVQTSYDVIIKTRFDITYNVKNFKKINFADISDNEIYITTSGSYPEDKLIFGKRDTMTGLFNFVISEYYEPTSEMSWKNPPHGLLENYIVSKKLEKKQGNYVKEMVRPV